MPMDKRHKNLKNYKGEELTNWTEKEKESLRELWNKKPKKDILKKLPGRTWKAIQSKARREGFYNLIDDTLEKVDRMRDQELLEEISKRGYIAYKQEIKEDKEYKYDERVKTYKLGIVSDTHFGSKYQQLQHLWDFYRICEHFKVDAILHGGDVCEGNGKLYRGQLYEMFMHGAQNQLDYLVKNYPVKKGLKTYIIGGSHDYSFYKDAGYDILEHFADRRDDIEHLGYWGAFLQFGKVKIYLMHGSGGIAYARSYKMQKIIEQFAPEHKPHILLLGHYHQPCYMEGYRNIEGFQLKCFQSQTPYLKGKGYFPVLGGTILTIHQAEKGLESVDIYNKVYYVPIKDDY